MKWPQFELWRLFAATALIAVACWLVAGAWQSNAPGSDFMFVFAAAFFGAGVGLPFRRVALGVAVAVGLLVVIAIVDGGLTVYQGARE